VNGGNISDGPNKTSGSDTVPAESKKWKRRYEEQVAANNALSDRLRNQRAWATRTIGYARKHLGLAQTEIERLADLVRELGGDPDVVEEPKEGEDGAE